ncbi:MAG: hypothetical protein KF727_00630 [Microbacteriaceae bacterium]|nr:hypothetical protein [Microbacteriaceae bacterium]
MTTDPQVAPVRPHEHPRLGWVRVPPVRIGGRELPAWSVLVGVFAASRLVSTAILFALWATTRGAWFAHYDGGDTFWQYLQSWDVQWYQRVAFDGYPLELPIDQNGDVLQNTWAFFPVFPALVRVVCLTGMPYDVAAMTVAITFGLLATLALHRMLVQHFAPRQALWGAIFFASGPMSFLLQLGYAESTYLFFLFCALAAMVSRRYLVMIPFALVASFTHPGTLALAAALGLQGIFRLVRRQRILWHEWVTAGSAIVLITAAVLFWPVLIAQLTGDPSGYFDTELGWWREYLGRVIFVPFTPFFLLYGMLWGWFGYLVVAVVLAAVVFWLTRPSTRALGVDIWTYSVMYIAYLVAVFLPTQSLIRMLLPLSPLLGHPGLSATLRRRWIVLLVGAVPLQVWCVFWLWVVYPP